ncbi:nicotinamide mononucleotide transporter [Arthrobacter sp. KK5.5]|uniref:nicotinamide mononucleotide transporter n=1 Tax=Arthrobacter sp. KK5.5 TaxID=3373084 RepID=UPI003EE482DE
MDHLFFDLFGQAPGGSSATIVALSALGSLLTGVALLLLARRSDLGWWVQILAVFAGPLATALLFDATGLLASLPAMGIAAYGLWRFSKYPMAGRFGRAVQMRGFAPAQVLWGAAIVAVFTGLGLGPMLTSGFALSGGTASIWLSMVFGAVVTAGLVGLASGVRWAWLAIAAASVAYVVLFFGSQPALATLAGLVFQFGASAYGWLAWRQMPAEATAVPVEAYPPSPYST